MGTMDELISPAVVARLRESFAGAGAAAGAARGVVGGAGRTADFPALAAAEQAVPGLRLRQRVDLVRDALLHDLPAGFPAAERLVLDVLDEPGFGGWMIWPTSEFVVRRALQSGSAAHFDAAMALLARLTAGLTGEFAVRDLLIARPERALQIMQGWTAHDDEHVRRFASEGSRAYLPWAKRVPWLVQHPAATGGILDALHADPADYVRRSVANHLNDLSRIDPVLVTRTAAGWAAAPGDGSARVIRHGLRTLIKRADPIALALVGFGGGALRVERPRVSVELVPWSGAITFTARVHNEGETDAVVAIDYSLGFQRADGSVRPKTFKLGTRQIAAGATVEVTKTHSFRPITTRAYHPGAHSVTVQANGVLSPPAGFVLAAPAEPSGRDAHPSTE